MDLSMNTKMIDIQATILCIAFYKEKLKHNTNVFITFQNPSFMVQVETC